MINLLPPESQRQIRAGKTNVLLLRYCITTVLLAIPLFGLVIGVQLLMDNSRTSAEAVISENEARSKEYDQIRTNYADFKANLDIANSVLSQEIRYSRVILAIAKSLPASICLDSLSLNSGMFGTPIEITASGSDYSHAIIFKSALEEQTKVFENVHFRRVAKVDNSSASDNDTAGSCNPNREVEMSISITIKEEVSEL